ncbi:MAG TPA: hypothetical protein PLN93_12915, partial [Vicinamibacterales bacterium]|nr:hypothetical protein [Vicinamibacterales bacterium]
MSTRPRLRLRHLLLGAAAGALLWLQPGLVLDGQAPGSSAGSAAQADGQFCECEGCTSILVG